MTRDVYIVEAVRTPIGRRNGGLREVHPVALGALALREAARRAQIDPAALDDVVMGCVSQVDEQGFNVARNAMLLAGFPIEVPATTVDRQCGSAQQAVHFAAALVASGNCELVMAGGVESMSRVPMGSSVAHGNPFPPELLDHYGITSQGIAAERIAAQWGISRAAMEELALESHARAHAAQTSGAFESQIVPVETPAGLVTRDEGIRPESTAAHLATLKAAFLPEGRITAATSSQISDGAAALVLASEDALRRHDLTPRARIVAHRVVGSDPVLMLTGPVPATRRVLRDAGLMLDQIDRVEINEAFASVVLMWQQDMELADRARVNVNGGAMALGHPLGATGAILMTKLLNELERSQTRLGLQTMCCGGGLGTATIIERV